MISKADGRNEEISLVGCTDGIRSVIYRKV